MNGRIWRGPLAVLLIVAGGALAACVGGHARTDFRGAFNNPLACPPESGFCDVRPPSRQHGPSSRQHDGEGATVARHLQERYDDDVRDCRRGATDPNPLPAPLCSGILFRTTARGPGFDVWNPNPNNPQPNGVSFSWLRKDNAMRRLPWHYENGYIILPYFYADSPSDGYTQLTVLCGFPVDGATNERNSPERDGCGPHATYQDTGKCQDLGITTSAKWMEAYGAGVLYGQQCFFDLKSGPGAADVFAQFALIRNALGNRGFGVQNEVKISAWTIGDPCIPLEAFFYAAETEGVEEAKLNQRDFNERTGRWVPVIRVVLPDVQNGPAWFTYVPGDQAIP